MRARTFYALAASFAALAIAVPIAHHLSERPLYDSETYDLSSSKSPLDRLRERFADDKTADAKPGNQVLSGHDQLAADKPAVGPIYPPDIVGRSQIGLTGPERYENESYGAGAQRDTNKPGASKATGVHTHFSGPPTYDDGKAAAVAEVKDERAAAPAKGQFSLENPPPGALYPPDIQGRSQLGLTGPGDRGAKPHTDGSLYAVSPLARPWAHVADAEPGRESSERSKFPATEKDETLTVMQQTDDGLITGNAAAETANAPDMAIVGRTDGLGAVGYSTRMPYTMAHQYAPDPAPMRGEEKEYRDQFETFTPNAVKRTADEPVSTFSIDVDTASYSFLRRTLNGGRLPPKDSIRVEEMINYFAYDYPRAESADPPFKPTVTVVPAPWNPDNRLIHIAIKGFDLKAETRPRANLVFLIDVSGSMTSEDKLPLAKNAFRLLLESLKPDDMVGIVTYASGSGVALEPTKVSEKPKILAAIDRLGAGGSTAGAQGIADAYRLAEANFDKAAVNRVILATDGDFNVGITNQEELKGFVERQRETGIFLSVLGFGQGNLNDALMQKLAQNGNGVAAYIDTLGEARKVLVDEASSTLFPIAKDVKIQVEFNPVRVAEYRLIGYETRALKREDFNNDKIDAGDVGSGHAVTAIYEVTPVGAPKLVDDLRYGKAAPAPAASGEGEWGFLKLRYKLPKEDASKLLTLAIDSSLDKPDLSAASVDARFSMAVAAFGQLLRGQPYMKSYSYDDVIALANSAKGDDPYGSRAEFVSLVRLAKTAQP